MATATAPLPVAHHGLTRRFQLLARAVVVMITSAPVGAVLLTLWLTAVALSPLTLLVWAVLPLTALVRVYANAHRRNAAWVLGTPVPSHYRTVEGGLFRRVTGVLRDPASWRDTAWLFVHSIVATIAATVQVALFLGGLFYLVFPFLYWVTPHQVFGSPFGFYEIHSVAGATTLMPLAVLSFVLWYVTAVPLARGEARLTRGMLSA